MSRASRWKLTQRSARRRRTACPSEAHDVEARRRRQQRIDVDANASGRPARHGERRRHRQRRRSRRRAKEAAAAAAATAKAEAIDLRRALKDRDGRITALESEATKQAAKFAEVDAARARWKVAALVEAGAHVVRSL